MTRTTVFCIVEGQTENAVLKRLLAPHLGQQGIDLHAPIVRVGRGRGGVRFLQAEDLYRQIRHCLQDPRLPYVTTFFDYYAFPTSPSKGWGFVAEPKAEAFFRGAEAVAASIEQEIHRRAIEGLDLPGVQSRLIPYIQLHELEALLFAEPDKTAATFGSARLATQIAAVVKQCGGCEKINDRPEKAPSKRIESLFPGYRKGRSDFAHAPRVADRLDLNQVRLACPRFSSWLAKIESLAPQSS